MLEFRSTSAPLSAAAARAQRTTVIVVDDAAVLRQYVDAWQDLADHAIEPNVFHEPWMLLPAFEAFGQGHNVRFSLVFAQRDEHMSEAPTLIGLFPLQRHRSYRSLPASVLRLWQHDFCFLNTPLLREGFAHEALAALAQWAGSDSRGSALIEFNAVSTDGPFHQVLAEFLRDRHGASFVSDPFSRALLRRHEHAEAYLRAAMSGDNRRNLKRKERRLGELGRLAYAQLEAGGDLQRWIDEFLRLESSGWKGQRGTAMACDPVRQKFFRRIAEEGFRRGRLMLTELSLDGRAIAHRCSFSAGSASFFFKPGYDEQYAKFSPGLLLEVDNVARVHAHAQVEWMDSCTSPDNAMLNDLWLDRRAMHTILIGNGSAASELVVKAVPRLRWFKRLFHRG